MPLVAAEEFGSADSDVLTINHPEVVLDPLQITNVPRDVLGPPIVSLVSEDARVVNALDALLSRAWR